MQEGAVGDILLMRGDDGRGGVIRPRLRRRAGRQRDGDGWPRYDPQGELANLETWGRFGNKTRDLEWKDEEGYRSTLGVEKPHGEWNRLEIECRGASVRVQLNGIEIQRVEAVWPASGAILLQSEGSEWYVRELRVAPL